MWCYIEGIDAWRLDYYVAMVYHRLGRYKVKLWGRPTHEFPEFDTLEAAMAAAELLYA